MPALSPRIPSCVPRCGTASGAGSCPPGITAGRRFAGRDDAVHGTGYRTVVPLALPMDLPLYANASPVQAQCPLDQRSCVGRSDTGPDDGQEILSKRRQGTRQCVCLGSDQAESPVTTSNFFRRVLTN